MRYFIFTTRGAATFRLKNAIQCYCSPLYMLLCAKYVLVVNALYISIIDAPMPMPIPTLM